MPWCPSGIANMQIDFRAFVDAAGYTHSTDINEPLVLNTSTAWGEAELGKVWWTQQRYIL